MAKHCKTFKNRYAFITDIMEFIAFIGTMGIMYFIFAILTV